MSSSHIFWRTKRVCYLSGESQFDNGGWDQPHAVSDACFSSSGNSGVAGALDGLAARLAVCSTSLGCPYKCVATQIFLLRSTDASLGGVHTIVSHVASTTHRQLDDAALAAAGIAPAAVRFSIGLEDPDDLINDIRQALI